MRREYGMRRQAADGEISLHDKLLFIEGEGERKRDFICPSTASSSQFAIWTCLSAECIRNVTRDEGMVDGASEVGMVVGQRGHKRE